MVAARPLRRWWDSLFSIGTYPDETDIRRGKRRIVIGYFVFGAATRLVVAASEFGEGLTGVGLVDLSAALVGLVLLGLLALRPSWFIGIVNVALFLILVEVLAATVILGGLIPSELVILFGQLTVLGALIVLSIRAAFAWFLAYLVTLALAVILPERIEPVHIVEGTAADIAGTIVGVTVFAAMAYFVTWGRTSSPTTSGATW